MNGNTEGSALCVLVVDDNDDTRELLRLLLAAKGHTVHAAASGASALRRIAELHPDLIFLDLAIPDMDGFEVAKQVRRQPRLSETKIVAITGHGDPTHRQRARYAGFDGYLVKPIDLAQIEATIETLRRDLLISGQDAHPNC